LAGSHALIGKAKSLMGRSEETEAHTNEALRLCPRHLFTYNTLLIVGAAMQRLDESWLTVARQNCNGAVIEERRYWVKPMHRRDKVKTSYAYEGKKTKSLKLEE
jgi:hypothetical protein